MRNIKETEQQLKQLIARRNRLLDWRPERRGRPTDRRGGREEGVRAAGHGRLDARHARGAGSHAGGGGVIFILWTFRT